MPASKAKPKNRQPAAQANKLKTARKAETVARTAYDKAKKRAAACNRASRKAEVNLANKQLARIRIQTS